MTSAAYDIAYLQAGNKLLADFLLANDVYWPIGIKPASGEPPYPQFSLSGLLLFRGRAAGRTLPPPQEQTLSAILAEIDGIHNHWQVAWENKAAAEYQGRLSLWREYLAEFRSAPANNQGRYHYEVMRRAQLQLLNEQTNTIPNTQQTLLATLDQYLHTAFQEGDFIWEAEVMAGFPYNPHWYLYGALKKAG
jgi:hypothetical protein